MEIITPSDRININENIFSSGAAALKVLNSDDLSGVNSQIKKDKQHNRIYIQPNVKSYLRRIEVNGNVAFGNTATGIKCSTGITPPVIPRSSAGGTYP